MKNASFLHFSGPWMVDTKVHHVRESEKVSQVKQRIPESMRLPGDCFYLTLNSRLLDEDPLIVESGISRDMQMSACGRLRGGATCGERVCSLQQKRKAVGLPCLSVSGVANPDKTFPLVWVFRPLDTRGTFKNSNIWVGNRHRKLRVFPQCEGQCSGVLHVLWSQESFVPSRIILKKHRS